MFYRFIKYNLLISLLGIGFAGLLFLSLPLKASQLMIASEQAELDESSEFSKNTTSDLNIVFHFCGAPSLVTAPRMYEILSTPNTTTSRVEPYDSNVRLIRSQAPPA